MIEKIRRSATLVAQLPPGLQRAARDSYAAGLHVVFVAAACSTFIAYCIRFPVPDKNLTEEPASHPPSSPTRSRHHHHSNKKHAKVASVDSDDETVSSPPNSFPHTPLLDDDVSDMSDIGGCHTVEEWSSSDEDDGTVFVNVKPHSGRRRRQRGLSTYESGTATELTVSEVEAAVSPETGLRAQTGENEVSPEPYMRRAGREDRSLSV